MPLLKAHLSSIISITLCLSSFAVAQDAARTPQQTSAPSADEAALRALVDHFFAAYVKEDLEKLMSLWSAKSPDLAARRKEMQELFAAHDRLEVKSLAVRKLTIDGEKARARVAVEISATEAKTDKAAAGFGKVNRALEFVREDGAWKVWREVAAAEDLAKLLLATKTEEERKALLAAEAELLTVELPRALNEQGVRFRSQGNHPQALTSFRLAQAIAEQIGDQSGLAAALNFIGTVHAMRGDYSQAVDYFQQSLALAEKLGNRLKIANALGNIGNVYGIQGNYKLSLEYRQKALSSYEALGDKMGAANSHNNIGIIYAIQGNYSLTLEHYRKSQALYEELGDKAGIATALNNIAVIYKTQGDYGRALEYYRKSLSLCQEIGDREQAATALTNIGEVYHILGNHNLGLDYYRQSFALDEAIGNKRGMVISTVNIGAAYEAQGNYALALEYYQRARKLTEEMGLRGYNIGALSSIGSIYRSQGDYTLALEYYRKALTQSEALGPQERIGRALTNVGRIHNAKGDYAQALEVASRATAIARQIDDRELLWSARTTSGSAHRALNQLTEARQAFEEAIAAIESLRAEVSGEQIQQRFFETRILPYHAMVELLVAQNRSSEALPYAERAKARVLLDVLRSGRINVIKAMTAQEQEQERTFNNELIALNTQISRERQREQPDETRLGGLNTSIQKTRLDYEAFRASLYVAHPELKLQRGEAQPLKLEEARDLLPDVKAALLEYVVTEDRTYLFVLTRGAAKEQVDLKVHALSVTRKELTAQATAFRQQLAQRELGFKESARKLYDLLLGPARAQLQGKTTLVIVPDEALWELPFQALQPALNRYLVEDHALSYAPSLTVLREMMKARRRHLNDASAQTTLLAFGNPALGKETVERVQLVHRDERLSPLPEAEKEVKTLAQLYGVDRSKVYVGAEAREDRAKAEAGKFTVLHLATHGILNNASPMYSQVVLAQATGNDKEDGLLEAWEIMNLNLKASLVVLSACETARGRVGVGEGVVGLTWALFVAGSPTTVVSQWKVGSASTTALMLEFHRHLRSGQREGKPQIGTAKALREAALKMLRDKQTQHPFYWAGFTVVGDGR
jgi:CHAT domain-containing protein